MRRIFDWKFLVALTMAAMVTYLVWVGIDASQETARKGHRIDTLIQTVQREQADANAARIAATEERQQLLDNQDAMLDRQAGMERELKALRTWLAEQGIEVPPDLGTPRADPKVRTKPAPRAVPQRKRSTATPRKKATNPAGKPRGQSNDRPTPSVPRPPQAPEPPDLPRLPSLQELLDPLGLAVLSRRI